MRFTPFIFLAILLLTASTAGAQLYKIRGTVYDSSRTYPMEAVSVLSSSGRGTTTNSEGFYEIEVSEKDSIWFSYLNKPTVRFPVLKITNPFEFDISLHVSVPILKEVKIRPRNYKQDSLQNRLDYAKVFNYEKPKLKAVTPQYGAAAGFDLDALINMFRFRHTKSMVAFQKRLLQDEHDKFIDHRFNKAVVRRLTQLTGNELDSFMRIYRPTYSFTLMAGDYEFQEYIKNAFANFQRGIAPSPALKEEEQ